MNKIDESFIDVENQNNEKVKALFLEVGINAADRDNRTLLHNASCYNNPHLVSWALENGVNVNHKDNAGWSALHFAVQSNNSEIVARLLKDKNKSVDIEDNNGNTPLWRGIMDESDFKIIQLLIKNGANPLKENKHQVAPKDLICEDDENCKKVSTFIIQSCTKDKISELSQLILDKQLYSEAFKTFSSKEMDKDWSDVIYEIIDEYPYKLNTWTPMPDNANFRTMQIGNSSCYEVLAEFTTEINGKTELSELAMDLEYNTETDTLEFFKIKG